MNTLRPATDLRGFEIIGHYRYGRAVSLQEGQLVYSYDRKASAHQPLYGHTSPETAYMVEDYPYSFKLRCRIRYWLEHDHKKGFRFVSQTENPKTNPPKWNNPKKSTYSSLGGCMYIDEQGHVQWAGVTEYSDGSKVLDFVKHYPGSDFSILKPYVKKKIQFLDLSAQGKVVWKVNGVPQPVSEEDMGRSRADLEAWQQVDKLI